MKLCVNIQTNLVNDKMTGNRNWLRENEAVKLKFKAHIVHIFLIMLILKMHEVLS